MAQSYDWSWKVIILFAEQSDKWQHSFERYLGFNPDTFFSFGILPGVCREAMGRRDWVYTNPQLFRTDKIYSWSDFHHKRLCKEGRSITSYYGSAPWLWDLDPAAPEDAGGSLFFLPRDDCGTIRDADINIVQEAIDSAPEPITFLLPWRLCDQWESWEQLEIPGHADLVQMSDRSTRQLILTKLFQKHEYVYLPWVGTDLYYAEFLDKKIVIYDSIKNYRKRTLEEQAAVGTKNWITRNLVWGYDFLNDTQKEFFHHTEKWYDMSMDDRKFLTSKMLGLDALKSPRELYEDLVRVGYLHKEKFSSIEKYNMTYEWLKSKCVDFTPSGEIQRLYAKL